MIDRRILLLAGLAGPLAPRPAVAQRPWKIGILALVESLVMRRAVEQALEQRWPGSLAATTFIDRHSNGEVAALPRLAREIVAEEVDLILARLTPAALAAKAATSTIPIVATMGAAVEAGIAGSLAQPGRNITGVSSLTPETTGKLVEIAREMFPGARRFGFLANGTDPLTPVLVDHVLRAAHQTGREVQVEMAQGPADLPAPIERLVASGAVASILQPSLPQRAAVSQAHAARHPLLGPVRAASDVGALASYAGNQAEIFAMAGELAVQVLSGVRPADIPIRQPTRFELVINLRAARALGLTLPAAVLVRADEVIE